MIDLKKCALMIPLLLPLGTCWAADEGNAPASTPVTLKSENLKTGILLQTWAVLDQESPTSKNNFRARRAELKFSGTVSPKTHWNLQIDPAKSLTDGAVSSSNDNKILQDYGVGYTLVEGLTLTMGQFKILGAAEGLESSGKLLLPERSLLARTFGDRRQTGMKLSYEGDLGKVGVMASNGGKSNTDDTNTPKDLYLRGDFTPHDGLSFGAHVGGKDSHFSDALVWGLNASWSGEKETVRVEVAQQNKSDDGATPKTQGVNVDLGYQISSDLQGVIRWENLVTEKASGDLTTGATTLGLTYMLQKHQSKIQLAHGFLKNMKGSHGSYTNSATEIPSGQMTTLAFQVEI